MTTNDTTTKHPVDENIYATVIEDSESPITGLRVTTIEVNFHRFVLAEFNTHRVFSRNSASSRAIPVAKQIEQVRTNPAIPLRFPAEQRGMTGGEDLPSLAALQSKNIWLASAKMAVLNAEGLASLGVHKSVTNRVLEPYLYHRVIVTSTEWGNFFAQRIHPDAQPEIAAAAECMKAAMAASEPVYRFEHLPYITHADRVELDHDEKLLRWVSAARCARVSYLTHEGVRSIEKDLALFEKLASQNPPHLSPLEHVATAALPPETVRGNLAGWHQLRTAYEAHR